MTTPASPVPPKSAASFLAVAAWTAVALLWLAGGSNYLTRTMLTTMRGSVIEDIAMTEAQFGLLTSGFLVFYAAASPFGGFLADRFSRRLVILWSIFAWSAITWITAYVKSFEHFLILRCLLGLSQAFYIPAAVALIVDYHRGPTRALATGIHLTGMIVGAVIGGVGGWLAEKHGWRYAYTTIALPNLALGILLYFFLRDAPREHLEKAIDSAQLKPISMGEAARSLGKPGAFHYVIACLGVQGAVSWIIIAWMPTLIKEQFKMGQGAAGFSTLGFLYVAQAIGLLGGGFWSDRLSLSNPRARIIMPAVAILLTTPLFLLTGWFEHISFTLLTLAMWGLAMGFLGSNTMPIVCLVVDARYRATAIGVLNGFTAICGSLAIYGVGALRDAKVGISLILTFAAVGVFFCGLFLWMANLAVRKNGPVSSAG
jgi:predicted MFS family arabinose efflux permease